MALSTGLAPCDLAVCVLIAGPQSMRAHEQTLPVAIGMAVETSSFQQGTFAVALYLPDGAHGELQGRREPNPFNWGMCAGGQHDRRDTEALHPPKPPCNCAIGRGTQL